MSIETRALRRVVVALNRTQFVCGRRKSSLRGILCPQRFMWGKPPNPKLKRDPPGVPTEALPIVSLAWRLCSIPGVRCVPR